ncbi:MULTISPECIES: hypothetical protein [Burkholderia]|nr:MULTISPECIES: hypothetical protein [Burkholderia]MWA29941.1 hypothetical protein [Burkholderia pseudomallei]
MIEIDFKSDTWKPFERPPYRCFSAAVSVFQRKRIGVSARSFVVQTSAA